MFLLGAAAVLLRTLWSLGCVARLIRSGRRERQTDGVVLVRSDRVAAPFSWGRYIVLPERGRGEDEEVILIHERAHLRLRHSLDLLAADLAGCLQWFNPAMWLLRREIRAIHEYEADEAVLASGVDAPGAISCCWCGKPPAGGGIRSQTVSIIANLKNVLP